MPNKASSVFFLWFQAQVKVDTGYFWSLCFQSLLCLWAQGASLQHIKRCPTTKLLCVFFFFFHGHKDRLLMRLQSRSSDLTLGLLSRVSARIAKKKRRETLSDCSRFSKWSLKGIFKPRVVSLNKFKDTKCISDEFDLFRLPLLCILFQKYSCRQHNFKENVMLTCWRKLISLLGVKCGCLILMSNLKLVIMFDFIY